MDEESIISAVRGYFAKHAGDLIAVYIFGSVARRASGRSSDVDIAVLFAVPPAPTLSGLALETQADLEQLLGCAVQLVVLNDAPVDLAHRVLRDGALVFESDRAARVAFEVAARREYLDLLPILRRYRQAA
ncbi:MAG: nucleotidyltransferase domain-containing protein [Betaproteobacteria bacterium]